MDGEKDTPEDHNSMSPPLREVIAKRVQERQEQKLPKGQHRAEK